jgi:hypothetical protein
VQKTYVATVNPSSDGRADIICPSLLKSTVMMGELPFLLDKKQNLYLVCKRRHHLK